MFIEHYYHCKLNDKPDDIMLLLITNLRQLLLSMIIIRIKCIENMNMWQTNYSLHNAQYII